MTADIGPKKILLIRLGSLGDITLITPVLSSLHARFPDARIDLAVKREYEGLFEGDPRIGAVSAFDSRGVHRGIRGLLKFAAHARSERYDLIIDLHGNLRSLVIRLGNPRVRRMTYLKEALRRRLLVWFGVGKGKDYRHTVRKYLDVLKPLGITDGDIRPRVHLSPENARWARDFLKGTGTGVLLGIAPMARWATKRWPAERFTAVAERAGREHSTRVIWFGAEDEGAALREIAGPAGRIVTGDAGLKNLAAVIRECSLFLTNDSGLMHLAGAVGTPVAAVFGPTTRELGFFPLGPHDTICEKDMPCRPCSLHGNTRCPEGHFRCMDLISVDDVYAIIHDRLGTVREER